MTTTEGASARPGGEDAANRYVLLDHFNCAIDIFAEKTYGWGRDYHLGVLRDIEARRIFSGLTFFIAYHPPETLPDYGPHVVLVLIGDEFHLPRAYFARIAAILRCYGTRPIYVDGWPMTGVRLAAAAQYIHKQLVRLKAQVKEVRAKGWTGFSGSRRKTLQVPLGYFRDFQIVLKPMAQRTIDHSFMGSVGTDFAAKPLLQKILDGPKYISRRQMLAALTHEGRRPSGAQTITPNFEASALNHEAYIDGLANTRIALVPRGISHETYRFFEAFKAGCVVICEPQPQAWYNRGHPGIVMRDWSRLPQVLEALLADMEHLEALSQASAAYWQGVLQESVIAETVSTFLRERLDKVFLRLV